jgi:hypothetical protein
MISVLTHIVVMLLDRVEAEGRALRRAVADLGWALAFTMIAAFLLLIAVGLFLWGVYQIIVVYTSPVAAALLLSFVTLVLAALAAVFALRRVR